MIAKFKLLPKTDETLVDSVMESQLESNQLFLKVLLKKKHTTQTFNFVDSAPESTAVSKGLSVELNEDTKFIFEGYFLKGIPNGLGRMLFGSGNVYTGMF